MITASWISITITKLKPMILTNSRDTNIPETIDTMNTVIIEHL
jgi:hypothetical protein